MKTTEMVKLGIDAAPDRFEGIERPYSIADVKKLRGSVPIRYTLADITAKRLWYLLNAEPYVHALGAVTGNQATQMVRAGLKAIYLSGRQVAADATTAHAGPELARHINRTLHRADQIEHMEGRSSVASWFAPIVAGADAGFGGPLNAFEIMKAYIEAGVAGVHFEDQLAPENKCAHLGSKVLIPTAAHIRNLVAARLAADVMGVATLIIARTDAASAKLITSDVDERDHALIVEGERTAEGFYKVRNGVDACIARGLAYAPYADLLWWEASVPNLFEARRFAEAIHKQFPGKKLAYNCSPSFNWEKTLDPATLAAFQRELGAMGYKFQFVDRAGLNQLDHGMFELARDYRDRGMAAYSELQQAEISSEAHGYTATRRQREIGAEYFDAVALAITGGASSTTAASLSAKTAQFQAETILPAAE